MNESIEALFKDISTFPAIIGVPSFNRSEILTQEFQVPFKLYNDDITHKISFIYNSRNDIIKFGGSMASRLVDMYGVKGTKYLTNFPTLIYAENIEDTILGENQILVYGLSRPKPLALMSPELLLDIARIPSPSVEGPKDALGNYLPIISNDEKSVEALFKHVEVFPAHIYCSPEEFIKKGPIDFILYFRFDKSEDKRVSEKVYNMRLNDSVVNTLMHLLDAANHDKFIGKHVSVYARYMEESKRLVICGMGPYEQYERRSEIITV